MVQIKLPFVFILVATVIAQVVAVPIPAPNYQGTAAHVAEAIDVHKAEHEKIKERIATEKATLESDKQNHDAVKNSGNLRLTRDAHHKLMASRENVKHHEYLEMEAASHKTLYLALQNHQKIKEEGKKLA